MLGSDAGWRWDLARLARAGEERVVILEKLRRWVWEGDRFLSLGGGLGASEEADVRDGDAGGVGPGLRRSSGIESDELVAMEPPCAPRKWADLGVVAVEEPGMVADMALPSASDAVFRELGVGGKLRENGEGSSPGCRGMEAIDRGGRTCFGGGGGKRE
jgi:hypothetical protein